MTRRRFDTRLSPARDQQSGHDRLAVRTSLPVAMVARRPWTRQLLGYFLAVTLSFVVGQHCTLSPASESRKGMISNDDDQ